MATYSKRIPTGKKYTAKLKCRIDNELKVKSFIK